MFARPVDSAIVAARAPWSVKCSVVKNVTAAGRGSVPVSPILDCGSLWLTASAPRLDESLHEGECRVGYLAPAAVDREGVPAVRDLLDLGHGLVPLLPLVGRVCDRPRDRVVLLPVDDQQRAALGMLRLGLCLGPGVEVCHRRLK